MNELPCGKCVNYDPILGSGEKHIKKGWCAKRSKYPAQEGPGQTFPRDVQRVTPGQLAEPFVVREDQIVGHCADARATSRDAVKAKKDAQTKTDKSGKRILS
jgi:hypothetical protein